MRGEMSRVPGAVFESARYAEFTNLFAAHADHCTSSSLFSRCSRLAREEEMLDGNRAGRAALRLIGVQLQG